MSEREKNRGIKKEGRHGDFIHLPHRIPQNCRAPGPQPRSRLDSEYGILSTPTPEIRLDAHDDDDIPTCLLHKGIRQRTAQEKRET